jgi:DNA-binding MarR family transcriptional regulator
MARTTKEPKVSRAALAADVWRMMADFTMGFAQRGAVFSELKRMGLTPGHLKVLTSLRSGSSLPMGAIADRVGCDPSMATWLIDRLEEQELAERQMQPTDRRVKAVSLTPEGERVKARLLDLLYQAPDELRQLDTETLSTMRTALAKLPPPPSRRGE